MLLILQELLTLFKRLFKDIYNKFASRFLILVHFFYSKFMDNIYIEYHFTVTPKEPGTEILIAELGAVGFESFVENENGVTGYIQKEDWNPTLLDTIFVLNSDEFSIES